MVLETTIADNTTMQDNGDINNRYSYAGGSNDDSNDSGAIKRR
jgi:hypothetical protein